MRVRWRGLELPSQVVSDKAVETPTYGRFTIEPFERGFGTTVGNSLRRILLSSLEGAAVTAVKMTGVTHEFMAVDGILEDVTDIILNIKSLVIRMDGPGPKKLVASRSGKGDILAGDIQADPGITILNPDLVLATLTDEIEFKIEMDVNSSRGYATASENKPEDADVMLIPIDSLFSPVTRVRYQTEDTRVGQKTNYDRLIIEIWTKGTTSPEMALVEAAKIMRKHLNPFVQFGELGYETATAEGLAEEEASAAVDDELRAKVQMSIQELELSVRATNCLEAADITTVGELVQREEADLLKVRNLGKTSMREVKRKLAELDLSMGMGLPEGILG